jgi:hypothetical protein
LQLLQYFVNEFRKASGGRQNAFVAIARRPRGEALPDNRAFLDELKRLADKTLRPRDWMPRDGEGWEYRGPDCNSLFALGNSEECLLWDEPGLRGFDGFRHLAKGAWLALPHGLREYKPLLLNASARPTRKDLVEPDPAWQWVNFVFRRLLPTDYVRRRDCAGVELLHLTVSVTLASALAGKLALAELGIPVDGDGLPPMPRWDRATRQLWLGTDRQRVFRRHAHVQFMVLDAFQAAGWKAGIPNPLGSHSVKDTVSCLNRGLRDGRLRFRQSDEDSGIGWFVTPV